MAARWLARALGLSYGRGQWIRVEASSRCDTSRERLFGISNGSDATPFASGNDNGSFVDTLGTVFAQISSETRLTWRLQPIRGTPSPADVLTPPPFEPIRVPEGLRLAPLAEGERSRRSRWEARAHSVLWTSSVEVSTPEGPVSVEELHRVARLIEVALHAEGDRGLRFGRPIPFLRSTAPQFLLSEREVAGLFPSPDFPIHSAPVLAPPVGRGWFIGVNFEGRPCRLALPSREGRHLALIGQTGMGKSSLIVRLALQATRTGGVVLLDPLGDTGRRFLRRLPATEAARVRWISPVDSPIGINALSGLRGGKDDEALVDRRTFDLVDALRRVRASRYLDSPFWGPRIEETVTHALRAAASFPEGTLVEAHRLLESAAHLSRGIPEEARARVAELRARVLERPEEVDGARRLLGEITSSTVLRKFLCDPASEHGLAPLVRDDRIVVLCGDAPQVGENVARYLLGVYLALVWAEILARPTPSKLVVILDEVQWYANESLAQMFRLGRRFNLHVIVATQGVRSLPDALREAVLTNVADFVLFRGSPDEAAEFSRWFRSFAPEDLLGLPPLQAVLLRGRGEEIEWVRTESGLSHEDSQRDSLDDFRASPSVRENPRKTESLSPTPSLAPTEASAVGIGNEWTTDDLLLVLSVGLASERSANLARVPLSSLRAEFDPAGRTVRALGNRLRKAGLLQRTGRDQLGSFWELAREGWTSLSIHSDLAETRALDLWRRLKGRSSAQDSQQGF